MASHLTSSHWIVTVPNELGSSKATLDCIAKGMAAAADGRNLGDVYTFDVPPMKVGSLDMLMAISDELARADSYAETVVRKVERQIVDTHIASRPVADERRGDATPAPFAPAPFLVDGLGVHEYIKRFAWDAEQFDSKEPLPELLKRLVASAERIDTDVRACVSAYSEKKTALVAADRRRTGNLMVAALEDLVTPQVLEDAGADIQPADSEFLATVAVVIPKVAEEAFLETYAQLDPEAVPVGPESNRESRRCSPVVPRSARRLLEDKDAYVLYTLTILKKFGDSFRTACREKRYVVRELTYSPGASAAAQDALGRLESETAATLASLREQAARKYGEAVSTWLHVKAVRCFVESVLRYGLPVNFVAVVFHVTKGSARRLLDGVMTAWRSLRGRGLGAALDDAYGDPTAKAGKKGKKGGADDYAPVPGVADAGGMPFVFLDFDVRADTASASRA